MDTVVVTGASGFVGRRLLPKLVEQGLNVVAIARSAEPSGLPSGVRWLRADLLDPSSYEASLKGASVVIHLAAVTGKAWPSAYQRGNVDATRALLTASERAGVARFVLVSSIAAKFSDRRFYPYAESKIAAEEAVKGSSLQTTIVRPTMIFGRGSPVQSSMERLARLPIVPVFGNGRTRVQPVDVDDVVLLLAELARDPSASGLIELGGPRVQTMDELVVQLRKAGGLTPGATLVHLPLGLLRYTLALVEKVLLPLLPFSAGQLASFANDGTADASPTLARLLPNPRETPEATA